MKGFLTLNDKLIIQLIFLWYFLIFVLTCHNTDDFFGCILYTMLFYLSFQVSDIQLEVVRKAFRVFFVFLMMVLIWHWNSCVQYFLSVMEDFPQDCWVVQEKIMVCLIFYWLFRHLLTLCVQHVFLFSVTFCRITRLEKNTPMLPSELSLKWPGDQLNQFTHQDVCRIAFFQP